MTRRTAPAWLLATLALATCDGPEGSDGGMDGAIVEGGTDAARRDAPPLMCSPACAGDLVCCPGGEGNVCVSLREDVENCGDCGVDCVATGRGDACTRSNCSCGDSMLGCRGTRQSTCCVLPGVPPYCGNLDQDADNCGECGRVCDAAVGNRCDGGECRCGIARPPCDGTPESTCCVNGVDVGCVDLTSDTFNCGECDNLCQGAERCEFGACTSGPTSCPAGCPLGEVCCDGTCCSRSACGAGTCGPPVDAGVGADAGAPTDAGAATDGGAPADAGAADAGTPTDAGPADAG